METDVTKRSSEVINNYILNSVKDGIYGLDIDGNTTFVNPAACEMVGYSAEEMIGKNQHQLVHHSHEDGTPHKSSDCPIYAAIQKGKTTFIQEDVFWHKDGHSFPVEYISTPIFENDTIIGAVITFRDISEKKQMEELLIKSEKLSVVSDLSAGIAHEIGNPLTSLKGFLQLFEAGTLPKEEYLTIMKDEIDRIEEISQEMLSLAKPSIARFVHCNVGDILLSVIKLLETLAFKKSIQIKTEIPEDEATIFCIQNQLKQAFINIIKNAIEAMDQGTIFISMKKDDHNVIIHVQDNGPGIPDDLLSKLGEPFFSTKEKGTGLGLMVTYRIIQNHQGSVEVKSKVNEGTTFTITLPTENTQA